MLPPPLGIFTVTVPLEPPGIVPLLGPFWIENVWETLSLFWIRTVSVWLAPTVGRSGEYLLPEIVTLSVVPPPPEGGDVAAAVGGVPPAGAPPSSSPTPA